MVFNRKDNDGFESRSFISILMAPFTAIQDWIGDAISGDDSSFRGGDGNPVVRILTLPLRMLWGFAVFMVQAWSSSRNGIAFLRGLPAFSILAFTPILLWGLSNYSRQLSLFPTIGYQQMHNRNQAFDNALLFSRKMVDLRPDSDEFKYMLAESISRAGDDDEAARLMQFLAGDTTIEEAPETPPPNTEVASNDDEGADGDEDGDGEGSQDDEPEKYAAAHVWLSQRLIKKQRVEGFDETRNTLAMDHLRAAIAADPKNFRAKVNLVDLYLSRARSLEANSEDQTENLKLARESLEALTNYQNFSRLEQVMAMPKLVDVCVKLDDETGARRALDNASSKVTRLARLNPEVYEIWFSLVHSAVAMQDYELANEFIKTGFQSVKKPNTRRRIMQLASLVHIQEADDFEDVSVEDNYRSRLFALCKAIATNPQDVKIYDRLVDYIYAEESETEQDVWLRNSTSECPIPGVVHILIGTRELLRGDVVGGKTSWDIARHQFGSTEFVTHRLLSIAIRNDPKKFGEGKLLDTGLLLFPDQFMLYETRGTIKKNNGLYKDAIEDFEIVFSKMPELITVHKHLADCYEKTGNTEKVAFHTSRLNEILDNVDAKDREIYENVLKDL